MKQGSCKVLDVEVCAWSVKYETAQCTSPYVNFNVFPTRFVFGEFFKTILVLSQIIHDINVIYFSPSHLRFVRKSFASFINANSISRFVLYSIWLLWIVNVSNTTQTCHGHLPKEASFPPTMRVSGLENMAGTPHSEKKKLLGFRKK